MDNQLYVVVYLDKDGRMKANPAVYATEAQADAGAKLVSTVKRVNAWIMGFPDPRQVTND